MPTTSAARGELTRGAPPGASAAAGLAGGGGLLLLYVASAAPGVTFWDAGEFATAFATLGVPHPPGTPLLVLLGRVWTWALGLGGVSVAHAGALLAAVCTALVGGTAAAWLARRTGSVAAGVAGAWCAG
ncbi:MAG TPA: DUF2723 domain-containing protein, partial [Gemmatirosa sp.]|nr:DUF2723 domain-containing protein [Gemmatirosa sp.]